MNHLHEKKKEQSDIIFFSSEAWVPFSQRTQSIALEFAKRGYRVFFIEPMLSLSRIVIGLIKGESLKLQPVPFENIVLLRPFLALTTFRGSITHSFDRISFNIWFKYIRNHFSISENAVVYISLPYWWGNIIDRSTFPTNRIIYDCIDDCRVYSRNTHIFQIMERSEKKLSREANVIIATAKPLFDKLSNLTNRIHLISNGVDGDKFIKGKYVLPSDIQLLKSPRIGFVGALYHWIDFAVFEKIASKYKESNIILIGPTNSDEVYKLSKKYKNIHYLGPKHYDLIPDYIHSFDVCLNPFKKDNIGHFVNPLKLYEYLILGKPVISSRTKEMENFSDYVYLYDNYDEMYAFIANVFNENQESMKEKRIAYAKSNSWSAKVDKILELVHVNS